MTRSTTPGNQQVRAPEQKRGNLLGGGFGVENDGVAMMTEAAAATNVGIMKIASPPHPPPPSPTLTHHPLRISRTPYQITKGEMNEDNVIIAEATHAEVGQEVQVVVVGMKMMSAVVIVVIQLPVGIEAVGEHPVEVLPEDMVAADVTMTGPSRHHHPPAGTTIVKEHRTAALPKIIPYPRNATATTTVTFLMMATMSVP